MNKAECKLDGMEIELIVEACLNAIVRNAAMGDDFRARYYLVIVEKLRMAKGEFHGAFLKLLLERMEETALS